MDEQSNQQEQPAGHWDPENDKEVIAARSALKLARGEK